LDDCADANPGVASVGDPRVMPAQFHHGGELAALRIGLADGFGDCFTDDEHGRASHRPGGGGDHVLMSLADRGRAGLRAAAARFQGDAVGDAWQCREDPVACTLQAARSPGVKAATAAVSEVRMDRTIAPRATDTRRPAR